MVTTVTTTTNVLVIIVLNVTMAFVLLVKTVEDHVLSIVTVIALPTASTAFLECAQTI